MLVLGIETTGSFLSVGLTDGDCSPSEVSILGARIHSVKLLPVIRDVLSAAGRTLADLAGIAVSCGPGSFTGVRIGLTVAKTLGQVLGRPVTGVPSLDVLAYPLTRNGGTVLALVPARRGEVYAALYVGPGDDPAAGPENLDVSRLPAILPADITGPVLCVGEAVTLYAKELREFLGEQLRVAPPALSHPRGAVVAQLGAARLLRSEGRDPLQLQPVYLRPPAAELVWQARRRGEHV